MKKIKNLSDLKQLDGQLHIDESEATANVTSQPTKISRLDQLLNSDVGFNKYGTMDADKYKANLDNMNLAELREHASSKVGIVIHSSREKAIKQLLAAFRKHVAGFNIPNHEDSNTKLSKENLEIGLNILKGVK